jgi:hypothetical protein
MSESAYFGNTSLPPELDARVRNELERDEQLLWVGQPDPKRFARSGCFMVAFGVPFTAFAVFWMAMAGGIGFMGARQAGGFGGLFACFPLFGLPFVVIGLGLLSSPYWLRQQARRTCYALTDRRALIWVAGWFGGIEVRSYAPGQLSRIHRVQYADGCGDLIFEEIVTYGRDSHGHSTSSTRRYGFMAIPRVHEVEELLRRALLPPQGFARPGDAK